MDKFNVQNFNVKYSETDNNLALKPYSLLNFLQDVASNNAESLGFGYSYISQKNLAWFLIKYRMEFLDYPVGIENLIFKTQPRGYNKFFAYREFEILHESKILGRVFSVWSLVDINKRTPVLIENAIPDNFYMKPYVKKDSDLVFSRIKASENPVLTKEFEVRYNDLDVNGHANNGNYIVWGFEPLPFEFKITHKIKTLDMIFKKETKYGEKIIVEIGYKDDMTTVHSLKNPNGEDFCLIECHWTKFSE